MPKFPILFGAYIIEGMVINGGQLTVFFKSNSLKKLTIGSLLLLLFFSEGISANRCLYISSYHKGYEWSDRIEQAIRSELKGKCELKQFDMDSKRNREDSYIKKVALEAKALVETWQPDVVIVSDDNASGYILKPYFKDHTIPFVFCGINWTVDAYGFPYTNSTGMVEVAPIVGLLDKVKSIIGKPDTAFFIGSNTVTDKKNLIRLEQEAINANIKLDSAFANTMTEWVALYQQAQNYDFVIMGNYFGISDWDPLEIQNKIYAYTYKLSVTNQQWMMPYVILGLTKIPEEQGKWAAQVALAILEGMNPSDIPIVANRKWELWINETLLNNTDIKMPRTLLKKAKKSCGLSL